jgi:MFS family permease
LAIFAMVFLADIAIGIFRATFSLYANRLGATLTQVGIIGSIEGLTVLLVSVPIGLLSDRKDRRTVLAAGLLLFVASYLICSMVPSPSFLYPIRALIGVSVTSTFYVGIAFVSDIVDKRDQGLCIGIYTTCMGLGFAAGSAIGGRLAQDFGFRVGFQVAAITVLMSFAVLRWGPAWRSRQTGPASVSQVESFRAKLAMLGREPGILAACLGYLGIAMANEGAIFNFFPLYAASLSISTAAIGSLVSVRMVSSSAARLPTGALVNWLSSKRLMTAALVLSMTSLIGIAFGTTPTVLSIFLVGEGMAFGMYFASGSAAVAEHTNLANRGTATGLFIMAGSIGNTLGPLTLGPAADRWGLNTVFLLTAATLLAMLLLILLLYRRTAPDPGARPSYGTPGAEELEHEESQSRTNYVGVTQ